MMRLGHSYETAGDNKSDQRRGYATLTGDVQVEDKTNGLRVKDDRVSGSLLRGGVCVDRRMMGVVAHRMYEDRGSRGRRGKK